MVSATTIWRQDLFTQVSASTASETQSGRCWTAIHRRRLSYRLPVCKQISGLKQRKLFSMFPYRIIRSWIDPYMYQFHKSGKHECISYDYNRSAREDRNDGHGRSFTKDHTARPAPAASAMSRFRQSK